MKPLVFVSCGQYTDAEKRLGRDICALLKELRPDVEPYFAEDQSTVEGLSNHILNLLERGAYIDARDVDHESTAAQYMVKSRAGIARYLIGRGCQTDILMAAALGDTGLVERHLQADPESIRMRVSDDYFPMIGSGGRGGGTIYQWELGWYVSACQVAKSCGHAELFALLMERSPAEEKLLNACWLHDEEMVSALLAARPNLADALPAAGRRHVAHAARNNDDVAVRLMCRRDCR